MHNLDFEDGTLLSALAPACIKVTSLHLNDVRLLGAAADSLGELVRVLLITLCADICSNCQLPIATSLTCKLYSSSAAAKIAGKRSRVFLAPCCCLLGCLAHGHDCTACLSLAYMDAVVPLKPINRHF